MRESVRVLPLSEGQYAVEVDEGDLTTRCRVVVTEEVVGDLMVPDVDHERLVAESVRYLLDRERNTELPEEIDLAALERSDPDFLTEVRARVGGPPATPEI